MTTFLAFTTGMFLGILIGLYINTWSNKISKFFDCDDEVETD